MQSIGCKMLAPRMGGGSTGSLHARKMLAPRMGGGSLLVGFVWRLRLGTSRGSKALRGMGTCLPPS